MTYQSRLVIVLVVCPLMALSRSARDGVYTKQQSARGEAVYGEECAKCHAQNLSGGDGSPELTGSDFMARWNGKSVGDLFNLMKKSMPTDDPGRLSNRQYADIAAFILSANGFPDGSKELDNDSSKLSEIKIEAKQ